MEGSITWRNEPENTQSRKPLHMMPISPPRIFGSALLIERSNSELI